MNISQHVILPNKWKLGLYNLDGTLLQVSNYSMSHWYPIDTTGHELYYLEQDAVTLYGVTLGRTNDTTAVLHQGLLADNYCIFDRVSPIILPSKPFTYILIK